MLTTFDHRIEYGQKLSHAGCQGHLLGIPRRQQPLIEGSEHRIVSTGDEYAHVEHCAQPGSSTPDTAFAPTGTAVSVERRHADQSGDPLEA